MDSKIVCLNYKYAKIGGVQVKIFNIYSIRKQFDYIQKHIRIIQHIQKCFRKQFYHTLSDLSIHPFEKWLETRSGVNKTIVFSLLRQSNVINFNTTLFLSTIFPSLKMWSMNSQKLVECGASRQTQTHQRSKSYLRPYHS